MPSHIAERASVDPKASIGHGSTIWDYALIRENAKLGAECIIGRGVYIGPGVTIGARSKIQSDALIYEPAQLGDGVFVGPAVVFTNDTYPRAIKSDGTQKTADDWIPVGVVVDEGAAIGARAVCVAPVRIGRWATVAAGSVVTKDVAAFALVAGVPARRIGWVGKSGRPLVADGDTWLCDETGERYRESAEGLVEA